jgi:hypothetical protein
VNRFPILFALSALLVANLPFANAAAPSPSPVNQVFQFMQAGTCTAWSDGQPSKATSYLWIPENCQRVRGLLILCTNVPEHRLVGHAAIRAVCAANDLAIVWSTPSFMNFKRTEPGKKKMSEEWDTSVGFLQQQLDALAKTSGYEEIATVPWLPIGESGHLIMVDALVETKPERCIAGVWLKNSHLPPKNRTVPALVVFGTAQEWTQEKSDIRTKWNDVSKTYAGILDQRKKAPDWPLSYVLDGHSGHFDCSERLTSYLAHYIDSAAKARLSADGTPTLRPGALSLRGRDSLASTFDQSLVARRLQHHHAAAETVLHFSPRNFKQAAGLITYYDRFHYHYFRVTAAGPGRAKLGVYTSAFDKLSRHEVAEFPVETAAAGIRLRMEMHGVELRFAYALGTAPDVAWQPVERVFEATLCGDWASPQGGFTGTFWGLCCQDLATRDAWADFSGFDYQPL